MALPMAQGVYRAKAIVVDPGEHNGKWRVAAMFQVEGSEYAGEQIVWYGYFTTEAATKITVKALDAMGWNGDLNDFSTATKNEVDLTIEPETWEGTTRLKVKWVNPVNAMLISAPMPDSSRKRFAAEVKGLIAKVRNENGVRKSAPKKQALSAEDVPF